MNLPNRVLLIDDDEEEFDILITALHECCKGIELVYEKNSEVALSRLCDGMNIIPEMIFLDWQMPVISGREILTEIRTFSQFNSVPIVIFTGSISPTYLEEAQALGASYFLHKQGSIRELKLKLEQLFSLHWKQFQSIGKQF
jgi:CheY-like chemotaxis protein